MEVNIYISLKRLIIGAFLVCGTTISLAQDGADVFFKNCAVCHKKTSEKFVGPGMAGITEKRTNEWLKSWIRDSQSLIASGDADAKAIFTEYKSQVMPPFPQFSDGEMTALVDYLGTLSSSSGATDTVPEVEIFYTDIQVSDGRKLFTGEKSFFNGGPSCISCHDVAAPGVNGGYLAKDLTDVYTRLGEAGIMAMIANAPFPAMNSAYLNNPVGAPEQKNIAAFLKSVSKNPLEAKTSSVLMMATIGLGGFFCVLILIMIIWRERKKNSVKSQIFARQIRSIN
jgi:mono/diheme cytochrome c family protein